MRVLTRSSWLLLTALACACGDDGGREPARDSGTPPRDAAADAAPDAAGMPDYAAMCHAASSEAACKAIDLPWLEYCDDCWHACLWVPAREVTRSDDGCEWGAASGACAYQRGGESGGPTSLANFCLGSSYNEGSLWLDRSGETPRVAYLGTGSLTYPGFESCGHGDTPFSRAPECECPCLPDNPDAECTPIEQGFESGIASGVEQCPGVPYHRVSAPECVDDLESFACSSERGTCRSDEDCEGAQRCLENDDFCACTSACATDADCAEDEACVCRGYAGPSTCVKRHGCASDGDCSGGDVCALSFGKVDDRGGCEAKSLACRTPYTECDGVRCDGDELCAYDAASEGWRCVSNDRCYDY